MKRSLFAATSAVITVGLVGCAAAPAERRRLVGFDRGHDQRNQGWNGDADQR